MTDTRRDWPAGLPLGPDAPVFTPPDPTSLMQRGRHTRRMHALVATTTAVALMAIGSAVAVNASAHRADRLKVVTPADHHHRPVLHGLPRLGPPHRQGPASDAGIKQQAASQPTTAIQPQVRVSPTPPVVKPASSAAMTATPFRRTTVTNPPATSCAYQPSSAPSGWCIDNPSPDRAQSGLPVDLSVEVCRIQGLGTGTLRFANAEEADVAIWGPTDATSWEWAHGRTFAATPHTVTVHAGQCLRWTTRWKTRANDGSLLPRGSYSIQVYVNSADTNLPNTVTGTATDFTLF